MPLAIEMKASSCNSFILLVINTQRYYKSYSIFVYNQFLPIFLSRKENLSEEKKCEEKVKDKERAKESDKEEKRRRFGREMCQ